MLFGSVTAYAKETIATIGMDEVVWMDKHWPTRRGLGSLRYRLSPWARSADSWSSGKRGDVNWIFVSSIK